MTSRSWWSRYRSRFSMAADPEVSGLDIAMPLSTLGRFIVDAHGRRVRLAGVNWYGFHEDLGVAPGLERTDRRALARLIAGLGFNSVPRSTGDQPSLAAWARWNTSWNR